MKQMKMMKQPMMLTNHGDILVSHIQPDTGVANTEERDMVRKAMAIILTLKDVMLPK